MCLTDPLDVNSSICGYLNRKNGLVYPCDLGCCAPSCHNVGKIPRFNQEFRRSGDGSLPPGFNVNLPQSDEPSTTPWVYSFSPPIDTGYKVWQIFLVGFVFLVIILLATSALKA
jgi:hypothetical protein